MKIIDNIRHAVLLPGIALLLCACSDDIDTPEPGGAELPAELGEYYFFIDNPMPSRNISYGSDETSEFDGGELLGCFALDADGNAVAGAKANACFVVSVIKSDNDAINGKKILVNNSPADKLDKGYAKYLFYYPYNKNIKTLDELKRLTHTVKTDQSKEENYEASDLLWDVAVPSDRYCIVEMDHAMANVIIVIDGVEYDVDKGAMVLQQPLTATNVNLTAPDINAMRDADAGYRYTVAESQAKSDIQAMYAQYSSANDRFRAAVPANRTLKAGGKIIKLWSKVTGEEKTFTLKNDITLEAGKNYYFTLIKKGKPNPSDYEDESWVLDVLDPETGEPVGLLCREYVRYQPEFDNGTRDVENTTSPQNENYKDRFDTGARINSQAWVFYNLEDDKKTPDLTKGVVMRFVYDLRIYRQNVNTDDDINDMGGGNIQVGDGAWPAPYEGVSSQGLYMAKHGHRWRRVNNVGTSTDEKEYYMHGTEIWWDGTPAIDSDEPGTNKIVAIKIPPKEQSATNADAYDFGHIAIPKNGRPYVSYTPLRSEGFYDMDGNKVGFTFPHYLVDMRVSPEGIDIVKYPLVKIGFNQFWMSESFRGRTLNSGKRLTCYNYRDKPGVDNMNSNIWDPKVPVNEGYIHVSRKIGDSYYDPVNQYSEDELVAKEILPLYNYKAFYNNDLIPISHESISEYCRPSWKSYNEFRNYVGWLGAMKMMSDDLACGKDFTEEEYRTIYERGQFINDGSNPFTANVSGLNLKSRGIVHHSGHTDPGSGLGSELTLWLYHEKCETEGLKILDFFPYSAWDNSNLKVELIDNGNEYMPLNKSNNGDYISALGMTRGEFLWSITYAPIRYILQYKVKKYKSDAPLSRSSSVAKECEDVYVGLE